MDSLRRIGCIVRIISAPQAYTHILNVLDNLYGLSWHRSALIASRAAWAGDKRRPVPWQITQILCVKYIKYERISLRRWNYSNYAPNTPQWVYSVRANVNKRTDVDWLLDCFLLSLELMSELQTTWAFCRRARRRCGMILCERDPISRYRWREWKVTAQKIPAILTLND